MIIGNTSKLTYTTFAEEDGTFTIAFKDSTSEADLGSFNIKRENGRAFIEAMLAIFRELSGQYTEYDDNNTAYSDLRNGAGTIEFNT